MNLKQKEIMISCIVGISFSAVLALSTNIFAWNSIYEIFTLPIAYISLCIFSLTSKYDSFLICSVYYSTICYCAMLTFKSTRHREYKISFFLLVILTVQYLLWKLGDLCLDNAIGEPMRRWLDGQ